MLRMRMTPATCQFPVLGAVLPDMWSPSGGFRLGERRRRTAMKFWRLVPTVIAGLLGAMCFADAQPAPGSFTIGMLGPVGAGDGGPPPAFIQALRELGYEQGRNLSVLTRAAKTSNSELPALAAELAALKPDVLVAPGTPPSLALKNATTSIPIVALNIGDPIKSGLVQSFAHPGGNVTGTANGAEVWVAKRLEAVVEALPGVKCVLDLRNPANPSIAQAAASTRAAAKRLGFEMRPLEASTGEELDRALAAPLDPSCAAAMFLPLDYLFIARRAQIAEFARSHQIALFAPFREDAEAGALMSFGVSSDDQWRLGAGYVDKILKGEKPADLPVQLPTKFEIVINLKTAKAIGVTIPQAILAAADGVIE
jgi:putative ABC transport system substrate-binding protein